MKGDRLVKVALNEFLREDPNLKFVFENLVKASKLNNPEAIYAIGTWYLFGRLVKKDIKNAVEHLQKAANLNFPSACFDLGVYYSKGKGKNLSLALSLFLKGALLGDTDSMEECYRCFYYGIGTPINLELANIFYDIKELSIKNVGEIRGGNAKQW